MNVFWTIKTARPGVYANFTNYFGVDVHIFRYEKGEKDRGSTLNRWFDDKRDVLHAGLT
jgi:hypothetical protein